MLPDVLCIVYRLPRDRGRNQPATEVVNRFRLRPCRAEVLAHLHADLQYVEIRKTRSPPVGTRPAVSQPYSRTRHVVPVEQSWSILRRRLIPVAEARPACALLGSRQCRFEFVGQVAAGQLQTELLIESFAQTRGRGKPK